jgi:hypothetical protein
LEQTLDPLGLDEGRQQVAEGIEDQDDRPDGRGGDEDPSRPSARPSVDAAERGDAAREEEARDRDPRDRRGPGGKLPGRPERETELVVASPDDQRHHDRGVRRPQRER